MDKYNIISFTDNLDTLHKDMSDWCNLPYEERLKSNMKCNEIYNMDIPDLFNLLTRSIMNGILPKDPVQIQTMLTEGTIVASDNDLYPEFNFLDDEKQTFMWKKQVVDKLEMSPEVVIISPFESNEKKDYDLDTLENKYMKYLHLSAKNKRFCDSYSYNLWGYNVRNMYEIMKSKILSFDDNSDNPAQDLNNIIRRSEMTDPMNLIVQEVNEKIINDDKLGLLATKLDFCCKEISCYDRAAYDSKIAPVLDEAVSGYDYSNIRSMVPYFTLDEMNELMPNHPLATCQPDFYNHNLRSVVALYEMGKVSEQEVIAFGWNPSVPLTEKSIEYARNRQIRWLQEHACKIVDVQNLQTPIVESTSQMRDLYKSKNLYPIYLVLSFSDTLFGNIIRKVKHSKFSHVGLSLDSSLNNIYTFKFGGEFNGLNVESLKDYILNSKDAIIDVLCIFVDKNTKDKLETTLRDFVARRDKTKYGFGNLFNILINRSTKYDPNNLSLVCSQFVDTVLKLSNINLNQKSSNLVIPQDFEQSKKNPKVFKLYDGLAIKYNPQKVDGLIYSLLSTRNLESLKYQEIMKKVSERCIFECGSIIDNSEADKVLSEMKELLTVEAVIQERKLPIQVTDKGDLSIELYKSLEDQYQDSHKIIKQYNENNIQGIKHELAKLFYINTTIESKIKKMKRNDENYKPLIDLRARVLNDFTKYLKIVLKVEPEFNFTEYYQSTDYYTGNITIDKSVFKFGGKIIKHFLK